MRAVLICALLAAVCLSSLPGAAQDLPAPSPGDPSVIVPDADGDGSEQPAPPSPFDALPAPNEPGPVSDASDLDSLFQDLRREPSSDRARAIAARISARWQRSGSATTDLLMGWAGTALSRGDTAAALDHVDNVLILDPDYAEGWNRRATINFQRARLVNAVADIEQTLAREPRHFGALMGLGVILEQLGRDRDALGAYTAVLAIYPSLKDAQDAVLRLNDELAGQPT